MMMSAITAVGALLFFLSHAVFQERRNVRRSEASEAAYYAAEAGIEATLADLAAGRAPRAWSGDGVKATVEVSRNGPIVSIVSTGMAQNRRVAIEARVHRAAIVAMQYEIANLTTKSC